MTRLRSFRVSLGKLEGSVSLSALPSFLLDLDDSFCTGYGAWLPEQVVAMNESDDVLTAHKLQRALSNAPVEAIVKVLGPNGELIPAKALVLNITSDPPTLMLLATDAPGQQIPAPPSRKHKGGWPKGRPRGKKTQSSALALAPGRGDTSDERAAV